VAAPRRGIGVGENSPGMVLNPFWGEKVAGVMVDGGLGGAVS
jgi:hypothetical protein